MGSKGKVIECVCTQCHKAIGARNLAAIPSRTLTIFVRAAMKFSCFTRLSYSSPALSTFLSLSLSPFRLCLMVKSQCTIRSNRKVIVY